MSSYQQQLDSMWPAAVEGSIAQTDGLAARATGLPVPVGAVVAIRRVGRPPLLADVVGFRQQQTLLFPHRSLQGVRRGDRVQLVRTSALFRAGPQLLGRVINSLGQPLDRLPAPGAMTAAPLEREAPAAATRPLIDTPLSTGVRAVDAVLTCGAGQRTAIVAGPGAGKSVLLGMIARQSEADVNVVAMIGERGREVNEFLRRDLQEGLAKSVVIVSTGDESAALRMRGALAAMAVAEHFRDQGRRVLLLFDSLTRVAMAKREIGLALGEIPAARGYPPSVYSLLPKIVERAGRAGQGSVTAFFSVLVDGHDPQDPIGDIVRGLLDGHLVLSRELADRGHFPALDVLSSVSRLMPQVSPAAQLEDASCLRRLLAARRDQADLISIGAYQAGSDPHADAAIRLEPHIRRLLCQQPHETSSLDDARRALRELADTARQHVGDTES